MKLDPVGRDSPSPPASFSLVDAFGLDHSLAVPDRPLLVIADTRRLVAPWWGYGSSHLQPADAALMVIVLLAIGSAWALGIVWTFSLFAVAQKADRLRNDALAGIVAAEVESNELVGELQSA